MEQLIDGRNDCSWIDSNASFGLFTDEIRGGVSYLFLLIFLTINMFCWLMVVSWWLANTLAFRFYSLGLHRYLSAVLFLRVLSATVKLIVSVLIFRCKFSQTSPVLRFIAYLIVTLDESVFISAFIAASRGWSTVRKDLRRSEVVALLIWVGVFTLMSLQRVRGFNSSYSLVAVLLIYVVYFISRDLTVLERILSYFAAQLSNWQVIPKPPNFQGQVTTDFRMLEAPFQVMKITFAHIKCLLLMYLVFNIGIRWMRIIPGENVTFIALSMFDLLVTIRFLYLFRLREPVFYELVAEQNNNLNGADPVTVLTRRIEQLIGPMTPIIQPSIVNQLQVASPVIASPSSTEAFVRPETPAANIMNETISVMPIQPQPYKFLLLPTKEGNKECYLVLKKS